MQTEDVQDVTEPSDIENQIERARDDLATTIDAIADRVSPKRVATRGVATAKDAAQTAAQTATDKARSAWILAQQKVADLRASKSDRGSRTVDLEAEPGAVRVPNPGMSTFPVIRRNSNSTKVAAVVAVGSLVFVVMRRRRKH